MSDERIGRAAVAAWREWYQGEEPVQSGEEWSCWLAAIKAGLRAADKPGGAHPEVGDVVARVGTFDGWTPEPVEGRIVTTGGGCTPSCITFAHPNDLLHLVAGASGETPEDQP